MPEVPGVPEDAGNAWDLCVRGADTEMHVRFEAEYGSAGKAQEERTIHVIDRVYRQSSSGVLEMLDGGSGDQRRVDGGTNPAST